VPRTFRLFETGMCVEIRSVGLAASRSLILSLFCTVHFLSPLFSVASRFRVWSTSPSFVTCRMFVFPMFTLILIALNWLRTVSNEVEQSEAEESMRKISSR
jgi:hypothetical protein